MGFFLFWLELKLTALTSDPEVCQDAPSSKAVEEAGHGERILLRRLGECKNLKHGGMEEAEGTWIHCAYKNWHI
jgi:hypothetical protein